MKKVSIFLITLPLFAFNNPDKKKIVADQASSSIMYFMDHPLHSFEASSKEFRAIGVFDDQSKQLSVMAVKVAVNSFDSGNSNRDSHVIEKTEALKYPSVTFTSEDISYNGEEVTAKGKLVFHGQTKPFTIKGTQKVNGSKMNVSGKFEVNMKDFGIKPPSLMGMSTDEIIKLDYMFSFDI
ncbi:YceI family protein [Jiulongibacter sp. NS-SX5]|uniref:YceI family protein n=1 Tax=Jiulongibacter sp. NS-SX5 TaxID=3463854 RepID=UPI0040585389